MAPKSCAKVSGLAPQAVKEGCFIVREKLEKILGCLRTKKNLILQGPPGTGKTWLARRLAFALLGQRDDGKVRAVQFHPNLSYEDFIRGWRPDVNVSLRWPSALAANAGLASWPDSARPEAYYSCLKISTLSRSTATCFSRLSAMLRTSSRIFPLFDWMVSVHVFMLAKRATRVSLLGTTRLPALIRGTRLASCLWCKS